MDVGLIVLHATKLFPALFSMPFLTGPLKDCHRKFESCCGRIIYRPDTSVLMQH